MAGKRAGKRRGRKTPHVLAAALNRKEQRERKALDEAILADNIEWSELVGPCDREFDVQQVAADGCPATMSMLDCVDFTVQAVAWLKDVSSYDKYLLSKGITLLRKARNAKGARKGVKYVMAAVSGAVFG